jgi:nitrogen regulatory protein P-II 1
MKEIRIVTRVQKLAALHAALRSRPDFPGMTVSKAEMYTAEHREALHSIKAELTDHVTRCRVELLVPDEAAEALFDAIVRSLSSGAAGDSLVWISDVERVSFVHKTL